LKRQTIKKDVGADLKIKKKSQHGSERFWRETPISKSLTCWEKTSH